MAKRLSSASGWCWEDPNDPGISETNVSRGNLWMNTVSTKLFICKDATIGAQIWDEYPTRIIPVPDGGTGAESFTSNRLLAGDGVNPFKSVGGGPNNSVLTGVTGDLPVFSSDITVDSISVTDIEIEGNPFQYQIPWTPVVEGTISAGTATYADQTGFYTTLGPLVLAQGCLEWSGHTGTGDMIITGFPIPAASIINYNPIASLYMENIQIPGGVYTLSGSILSGGVILILQGIRDNASATPVVMNTSGKINFTITYIQ